MNQDFTKQVKATAEELLHNIHTAIPGKIIKYDAAKCEAEILPYGKFKKPSGEFIDYPKLHHIPILFPQSCGQNVAIAYPIKEGDGCLIFIAEQTLDIWRSGGESNNDLRFDLTNSVALVGMFSSPQPLAQEAQNQNAVIIGNNGTRLYITADGYVNIEGNANISGGMAISGNVTISGNLTVSGSISGYPT